MPRKKETRGGAHNVKYKTEKQRKKAILEQGNRWKKENTRCINVRFNIEKDNDILSMLDSVPNKADYIRQLIRQDIASKKEEN